MFQRSIGLLCVLVTSWPGDKATDREILSSEFLRRCVLVTQHFWAVQRRVPPVVFSFVFVGRALGRMGVRVRGTRCFICISVWLTIGTGLVQPCLISPRPTELIIHPFQIQHDPGRDSNSYSNSQCIYMDSRLIKNKISFLSNNYYWNYIKNAYITKTATKAVFHTTHSFGDYHE